MKQNSTLVMKFGGAAVESLEHFRQVADLVKARKKEYNSIIVVISAMQGVTDKLISMAYAVNPSPPRREYDMLVTVGERMSSSLLAMALEACGVCAVSFTGSQAGIITTEEHSEAKILDVKPSRVAPYIEEGNVIVVAGFQGVSRQGAITSLGRGGSDTTAVALAIAFKADKVEFYKDVPGLFSEDPKINTEAAHYPQLTFEEALQVIKRTGKILHLRCVELAQKNNIPLHVMSFHTGATDLQLQTIIADKNARNINPVYEDYVKQVSYA